MSDDTEILKRFIKPERIERLQSQLAHRTSSLVLVLDHVHDPHNISAVLRSCDAFGVQNIHVLGNNSGFSAGISLGAERWLSLKRHKSGAVLAKTLADDGFELVILQPAEATTHSHLPPSVPVFELPFQKKLALIFGNEHNGVSEELASHASIRAHIPMFGFVESLNISVSAAICLFCSTFSGARPERPVQTLNEEQRAALEFQWMQKSVRGGEKILQEIDSRKKKGSGVILKN